MEAIKETNNNYYDQDIEYILNTAQKKMKM